MSTDHRAWFASAIGGQTPDGAVAHVNRQFEAGRVSYLLTRFKLRGRMPQMLERCRGCVPGDPSLRFADFDDLYPDFPFVFAADTLRRLPVPWSAGTTAADYAVHDDPHATEPARFKAFAWVPFVVAYQRLYAERSDTTVRPLGLVFPRRGFAHGMVIHNDASEQAWSEGLSWVYKVPDAAGTRLYVQPFQAVIEGIYAKGRGWRPTV